MKQIHIVGVGPRTGTTLLAEAMTACFNIDYSTEHEDRLFARPTKPADIYLSKHPADLFVVWPSLLLDPELYVICITRDPRDSIVSRHNKNKSIYWSGLRYWKAFIPLLKKYQHHKRFITLRYEDFVNAPDNIQQELLSKIPCLSFKHKFSEYHLHATPSVESQKALKSFRPIDSSGVGNWQQHKARVKQQVNIHGDISKSLIEFGYESDDSWLAELEHETPYVGNSHWPEFFTKQDLKERKRFKYKEALKRFLAYLGVISRLR